MQPDWIQMNCRKWKKKASLQCRCSLLIWLTEDPGGWGKKANQLLLLQALSKPKYLPVSPSLSVRNLEQNWVFTGTAVLIRIDICLEKNFFFFFFSFWRTFLPCIMGLTQLSLIMVKVSRSCAEDKRYACAQERWMGVQSGPMRVKTGHRKSIALIAS